MDAPGTFCDGERPVQLVGFLPADSERLEVIFQGGGSDEAFHVVIDPGLDYVKRWAKVGGEVVGEVGGQGEGGGVREEEAFNVR